MRVGGKNRLASVRMYVQGQLEGGWMGLLNGRLFPSRPIPNLLPGSKFADPDWLGKMVARHLHRYKVLQRRLISSFIYQKPLSCGFAFSKFILFVSLCLINGLVHILLPLVWEHSPPIA
jgi:hypothetical protein